MNDVDAREAARAREDLLGADLRVAAGADDVDQPVLGDPVGDGRAGALDRVALLGAEARRGARSPPRGRSRGSGCRHACLLGRSRAVRSGRGLPGRGQVDRSRRRAARPRPAARTLALGSYAADLERLGGGDVADAAVAQRGDARGVVAERRPDPLTERHEQLARHADVEQRARSPARSTRTRTGPSRSGILGLARDEVGVGRGDERVVRRVARTGPPRSRGAGLCAALTAAAPRRGRQSGRRLRSSSTTRDAPQRGPTAPGGGVRPDRERRDRRRAVRSARPTRTSATARRSPTMLPSGE